jgi:hypothetical protein
MGFCVCISAGIHAWSIFLEVCASKVIIYRTLFQIENGISIYKTRRRNFICGCRVVVLPMFEYFSALNFLVRMDIFPHLIFKFKIFCRMRIQTTNPSHTVECYRFDHLTAVTIYYSLNFTTLDTIQKIFSSMHSVQVNFPKLLYILGKFP